MSSWLWICHVSIRETKLRLLVRITIVASPCSSTGARLRAAANYDAKDAGEIHRKSSVALKFTLHLWQSDAWAPRVCVRGTWAVPQMPTEEKISQDAGGQSYNYLASWHDDTIIVLIVCDSLTINMTSVATDFMIVFDNLSSIFHRHRHQQQQQQQQQ